MEEYNQIIDEAYKNYCEQSKTKEFWHEDNTMTAISNPSHYSFLSKEKFINKCKSDSVFSKQWDLNIEDIKFPVIKNINAKTIANDLPSVQPKRKV